MSALSTQHLSRTYLTRVGSRKPAMIGDHTSHRFPKDDVVLSQSLSPAIASSPVMTLAPARSLKEGLKQLYY